MLRGFRNRFRVEYQIVNISRLETLPQGIDLITPAVLATHRMIQHVTRPVKVLGYGELNRVVSVSGVKVSGAAKAKIEAAGGSVMEA
jgi:large subunit ribosomal protein L15